MAVRNAVGLFDVSHMGRSVVEGEDSEQFLQRLTSNDVCLLNDGMGQYSLLCNEAGGIKDDIIVFRLAKNRYLVVYNASNRSTDFSWLTSNKGERNVTIDDISDKVALFAVQGPRAVRLVTGATGESHIADLRRFGCAPSEIDGSSVLVSRTGYTGEDGFEIYAWDSAIGDPAPAKRVWDKLREVGKPLGLELCGLGARDLLRLEAGLCLHGTDIDENTTPYEARLGFAVKLQKDFIGCGKLKQTKMETPKRLRVGLVTRNRVIPRHQFPIALKGERIGTVSSGTLSPLLNTGIAMGYVESASAIEGSQVEVRVRDRYEMAQIVKPPFYDPSKFGYSRKSP